MNRLEAVRMIEDITKDGKFDIYEGNNSAMLLGFKTEIAGLCLGCRAYQELSSILGDCVSKAGWPNRFLKEGRYLDLTEFFDLGEAKEIIEEYMEDVVDLDYMYDDEARELLAEMAGYEPMHKFIELLVGYPAWEPRQNLDEALADPEFFKGRKFDYSYETTVLSADIKTVRGALEWLYKHAFPVLYN